VSLFRHTGKFRPPAGLFESPADIGITPKTGSAECISATGEYRMTGGGANIWATHRSFSMGTVAHRKVVLDDSPDLNPDSAYANLAVHGDGLTSLQFEPWTGAATPEIRFTVNAPAQIRIERRGNQFTIFAA
jgi:TolB protein